MALEKRRGGRGGGGGGHGGGGSSSGGSDDDSDPEKNFHIWIGLTSAMIFVIVCRLFGTVVYFLMDRSDRRIEKAEGSAALSTRTADIVVIQCGLAGSVLVACGIVHWVIFIRNLGLETTDMQVIFAFWALSCVTTAIAYLVALRHTRQIERSKQTSKAYGSRPNQELNAYGPRSNQNSNAYGPPSNPNATA